MTKFNKKNNNVYLIAEIGSNHNQEKNLALEMIDMAADSGADAVKFQSIRFDKLYKREYETENFRRWFKQIELDESWYPDLSKQAKKAGVDFISSPTYTEAVKLLEDCDVPAYKLASPQVYGNLEIVREVAKTGKPLIMSLGYCNYNDIFKAIEAAESEGNSQITLLHCISKYPMKAQDANLMYIQTLQKMTGYPVGFSDHSLDDHLALAAVAIGACIIEKHVTFDRNLTGPDHSFAMTFEEFKIMSSRIRDISDALGDGVRFELSDEQKLRQSVELKAFSRYDLQAGSNIDLDSLSWSRYSGEAITHSSIDLLNNCVIRVDKVKAGTPISWDMVDIRHS